MVKYNKERSHVDVVCGGVVIRAVLIYFLLLSPSLLADTASEINEYMMGATECNQLGRGDCPEYLTERRNSFRRTSILSTRDMPHMVCSEEHQIPEVSPLVLDADFSQNSSLDYGSRLGIDGPGCFHRGDNALPNVEGLVGRLSEIGGQNPTDVQRHVQGMCSGRVGAAHQECVDYAMTFIPQRESRRKELNQILVADHYYSHLRLRTGMEEGLRAMTFLDSMVGDQSLHDQNCEQMPYEKTKPLCQSLKSDQCQTRAVAETKKQEMLELTKKVIKRIKTLEFEQQQILEDAPSGIEGMATTEYQEGLYEAGQRHRALGQEIEAFKAMAPWIEQRQFGRKSRGINRALRNGNEEEFNRLIEEGFLDQMRSNRETIKESVDGFKEGQRCLTGQERCDEDDMEDSLEHAPHPQANNLPHSEHFDFLQCLEVRASEVQQSNRLFRDVALTVGLTVASVIAPPIGGAIRLAQVGAAAYRAGGAARVIGQMNTARSLGAATTVGVGGADVAYAANSFGRAYQTCSSTLGELSFDRPAPFNGELNCSELNADLTARVGSSPNSCMSDILFAAIDAVPITAFASRQAYYGFRAIRPGTPRVTVTLEGGQTLTLPASRSTHADYIDHHLRPHQLADDGIEAVERGLNNSMQSFFSASRDRIRNFDEAQINALFERARSKSIGFGSTNSGNQMNNRIKAIINEHRNNPEALADALPEWALAGIFRDRGEPSFIDAVRSGSGGHIRSGTDTTTFPPGVTPREVIEDLPNVGPLRPAQPISGTGVQEFQFTRQGVDYSVSICMRDTCRVPRTSGDRTEMVDLVRNEPVTVYPRCGPGVMNFTRPEALLARMVDQARSNNGNVLGPPSFNASSMSIISGVPSCRDRN